MRRLTAILAIWLSLLGVAMPVLACSMGIAADSCCPVRTQSPCGSSDESQWNATVTFCCSAGPISASGPSVKPSRSTQDPIYPTTLDPLVASGWTTTHPVNAAAQLIFAASTSTHRADAALTYLQTGRLRL